MSIAEEFKNFRLELKKDFEETISNIIEEIKEHISFLDVKVKDVETKIRDVDREVREKIYCNL